MMPADTPKDVQDLFRTMLMRLSGAECLAMGCDMFDTSRAMLKSNLQARGRPDSDQKVDLFVHTYRGDFDPDTQCRIIAWHAKTLSDSLQLRSVPQPSWVSRNCVHLPYRFQYYSSTVCRMQSFLSVELWSMAEGVPHPPLFFRVGANGIKPLAEKSWKFLRLHKRSDGD